MIFLTENELADMISLQDMVIADLRKRSLLKYIVPRTRDYYIEHLNKPHVIVGERQGDALIAQAVYRNLPVFDPLRHTGLADIPAIETGDAATILQAAVVHPESRGRGLMKTVISHWCDFSVENGYQHALARVEVTHDASKRAFEQHGFKIAGTIIDARDGASVYVYYKKLSGQLR